MLRGSGRRRIFRRMERVNLDGLYRMAMAAADRNRAAAAAWLALPAGDPRRPAFAAVGDTAQAIAVEATRVAVELQGARQSAVAGRLTA